MRIERKHVCTGHRGAVYALAPWKDKRHFLSAGGDGWIVAWNLDDPETGRVIADTAARVFSLGLLPDGRLLAGSMEGTLLWIDPENPNATRVVQAHRGGVFDLLLLDEFVFSAGADGILSCWSLSSGRAHTSIKLSNQSLRSLAYIEWRRELAVGASDGQIYFLDADSLALKHTKAAAHLSSVFSLAFHTENRLLFSGGRDAFLRIWDTARPDAAPLNAPIAAHLFTVNRIAVSPDRQLVASASRDKTIKIWNADASQLLKVLDTIRDGCHVNSVNCLLWMEGLLISGSDDRSVMLWECHP